MSRLSRFLFPNPRYNQLFAGAYCSITGLAGYYVWNQRNQNIRNQTERNNLHKIHNAFINAQPLDSPTSASGICGRVKCMKPDQLTHLSGAHKPYSWITGSEGLYNISQCATDFDKLMLLGFEKDWIHLQLLNGNNFNLYLFPAHSKHYTAKWATWDGVFELLTHHEPQIYAKVIRFKQELQSVAFDEIESKSDFEFLDVEDRGPIDPRYLSKERFLAIKDEDLSLVDVRFFLYCYMGLSRYFDGDGYTVDKHGEIGCKEWLIKNMKLDEMENLKVIPLNITIPNQ
eukprot:78945_1